ncbi:oxygen-independent coproporphyrinogen III oxidase [Variovorax sp. PCZ-1]|nr:oxygen-independent coproporphyrinogen III oxidase [Variovorax sp. PCZ-1]
MPSVTASPVHADILSRWDIQGPRYTSYPTADRFVEAFSANDASQALQLRNITGGVRAQGLSLYLHIPFCESLCYYCACNKVITKQKDRADIYLKYLEKELDLVAAQLEAGTASVQQLHLGGGSPTFLDDAQLAQLMTMIRMRFQLDSLAECSIEVDPRTVSRQRLQRLRQLGFNRLSFGVQDFDAKVQKAVHRVQPFEQVSRLMQDARELGFASLNMDLIYGLPQQTIQSMQTTFDQVISLRPDRIALYGYAHLPQRFKPQRRIDEQLLPTAHEKSAMLRLALEKLGAAGYVYIGMDHFALPQDSLAIAKKQGRLHRNFQGYSTLPDCDLIGLGVSAISKVGAAYSQNVKSLDAYYDLLDQGRLPIERGLALSRDDLVRRAVIMALMCQGELSFESIELAYLIDFKNYFKAELSELEQLQRDGLVEIEPEGLLVTEAGWYVVRAVAMVFDRYLQADRNRARYSRII